MAANCSRLWGGISPCKFKAVSQQRAKRWTGLRSHMLTARSRMRRTSGKHLQRQRHSPLQPQR